MALKHNIEVKYVNMTGHTQFQVLVFTKNFNTNSIDDCHVAWEVIRAETSSEFLYPIDCQVGVSYRDADKLLTCGPFRAKMGSTWNVTKEKKNGVAIMKEGMCVGPRINSEKGLSFKREC